MKLTLVIVFIGLVCQSFGDPVAEKKTKNEICSTECNISADLQERIPQLNFKTTEEDKCYNLCLGRLFNAIGEDEKFKIDKLEDLFKANGLAEPKDMDLVKNISGKDKNFMENFSVWITNNKPGLTVIFDKNVLNN